MFTALAPVWFWALVPVVGLGVLALWRGRHYRQRVSSVWLWRGLAGESGGRKARAIDPVWAMVLAAAVLAALALPGVQVRVGDWGQRPVAELALAMRAMEGKPGELFIRSLRDERLTGTVRVEASAGQRTMQRDVPVGELRAGTVLAGLPADEKLTVTVSSGGDLLARFTLEQVREKPFGVMALGPVAGELRRVIELQPGARVDEPGLRPAVWLVDDPHFDAGRAGIGRGVVIASPRTPVEGIAPVSEAATATRGAATGPAEHTPAAATSSPLMANVHLEGVRVKAYRAVKVDGAWTVLATVDGHPWLATRRDGSTRYVWLASRLAETTWAGDVSFVVFFANVVREMEGQPGGGGRVQEWTVKPELVRTASAARLYALTPGLAVAALALVLGAMVLLVRRAR